MKVFTSPTMPALNSHIRQAHLLSHAARHTLPRRYHYLLTRHPQRRRRDVSTQSHLTPPSSTTNGWPSDTSKGLQQCCNADERAQTTVYRHLGPWYVFYISFSFRISKLSNAYLDCYLFYLK